MNRSGIPWLVNADGTKGFTWSPTTGCSPASAGCANCWARTYHVRYRGGDFSVKLHPEKLDEPLRRRKPSTIGVCLMGDLFHENVPASFVLAVFGIMAAAERHTFLVLTKRPERARSILSVEHRPDPVRLDACWEALRSEAQNHPDGDAGPLHRKWAADPAGPWPLPNVWLGVSVEDQRTADERIPILLDTPAAHRWVSLEPQIGTVDFRDWLDDTEDSGGDFSMPHLCDRIDWVVQGCESGPRRRPFDIAWARSVRDQCKAAGVPFYLKQIQTRGCDSDSDDRICSAPCMDQSKLEQCHRRGIVVKHPTLDGRQHMETPFHAYP